MMRSITKDNKTKAMVIKLGAAAFWLLIWQAVYLVVAQEILIVSPVHAFGRLLVLSCQPSFWHSVLGTCLRVLAGFVISIVCGSILAWLTHRFVLLYHLFSPLLEVIKATPVASFIILAIIWLAAGRIPAFIVMLMLIPMIWANLYAGLGSVDNQLLEMAAVFGFSRWKTLRLIYIPALMPNFLAACTTGLGFAWKSAIAAEVIAHPVNSIGTQIYNARIYLETADLYAWTIVVILLSVLLEKLTVSLLESFRRRMLGQREEGGSSHVH